MNAVRVGLVLLAVCGLVLPVAAETLPYDHMHMVASDPAAAVQWYAKYMGGEDVGRADRLKFGDTWFIFMKKDAGFPGSSGSSVDHIGISFPDLDAKMKEFVAAGLKTTGEIKSLGALKYGFVEDPWGTLVEVMQDPETLGFNHIHLVGPDPEGILDWYENAFGGTRAKFKGVLPALKYGGVWILVTPSQEERAPTKGRSIDHLGWEVPDMAKTAKELKEKGVTFTMEPRDFPNKDIAIAIAFVEGPGGARIELVQRP
jgi:catechol 2,3-dioxygenase-like lactoylglutathione lyase family enzyme